MTHLHESDRLAFEQALKARPVWDGLVSASDALGLASNILLHAGPPFDSIDSISKPILNSACVAAVFEGLAADLDQAEAMIRAGEIKLEPALDNSTVTPLAAVVSASMSMHRVTDANDTSIRIYAPINGGSRPSMRLGLRANAVVEHLRWLNDTFAELLESGLVDPIDVIPLAAEALRQGDDCHGRTPVGSRLMMSKLEQNISGGIADTGMREFIDTSPSLFLNLWMAASKCIMQRASGIEASSFITAAAGNGVETGIQVSGLPDRWFKASSTAPQGRFDVDLPPSRALPAIGDSAVVEGLGLGAMAIHLSPEQEKNLGDFLPNDYRARSESLLIGAHPGFEELDCKLGLSARAAVEYGRGPVIGLGILDIEGKKGRLGGGIYDMPLVVFEQVVDVLED